MIKTSVHLSSQNFKETSMKVKVDNDAEANSGPTLKRLRLRGDWSDTGPQALPEREMRSQTGGKLSVPHVLDPS